MYSFVSGVADKIINSGSITDHYRDVKDVCEKLLFNSQTILISNSQKDVEEDTLHSRLRQIAAIIRDKNSALYNLVDAEVAFMEAFAEFHEFLYDLHETTKYEGKKHNKKEDIVDEKLQIQYINFESAYKRLKPIMKGLEDLQDPKNTRIGETLVKLCDDTTKLQEYVDEHISLPKRMLSWIASAVSVFVGLIAGLVGGPILGYGPSPMIGAGLTCEVVDSKIKTKFLNGSQPQLSQFRNLTLISSFAFVRGALKEQKKQAVAQQQLKV